MLSALLLSSTTLPANKMSMCDKSASKQALKCHSGSVIDLCTITSSKTLPLFVSHCTSCHARRKDCDLTACMSLLHILALILSTFSFFPFTCLYTCRVANHSTLLVMSLFFLLFCLLLHLGCTMLLESTALLFCLHRQMALKQQRHSPS